MTLHQNDLQKLAKLLGMLGSAHDGEVLAAARKAHNLLTAKGASWYDVLAIPETIQQAAPAHHALARELLAHKRRLTNWERTFLRGILDFSTLTTEQADKLEEIRAKVEASVAMA